MRPLVLILTLFTLLSPAHAAGAAQASSVKPRENIFFFPSLGGHATNGLWNLDIRGWIFHPEKKPVTLTVFRNYLGMDARNMTDEERKIFAERTVPFRTETPAGRVITVAWNGKDFPLEKSSSRGLFSGKLVLNPDDVDHLRPTNAPAGDVWIDFVATLPKNDSRQFAGRALLLEDEGISVISDIDDTIKVTRVHDPRRSLLLTTFVHPYTAAPGMAALYQSWATNSGASFHYVSAGPIQLFQPLQAFVATNGFPEGTFHLRDIQWRKEIFHKSATDLVLYKTGVIAPLLEQFPRRRFVLVGDSGESDPEIYGALARKYPKQIKSIYIRDVTGEPRDSNRYRNAFKEVPGARWKLFRNGFEIKDRLK